MHKKTNCNILNEDLYVSNSLSKIIGADRLNRLDIVKRIWNYIKKNNLFEDRYIKSDELLYAISGKDKFTVFELAGIIVKNTSYKDFS